MATSQISSAAFLDQIKNRHSYYALSKDLPISQDKIQQVAKDVLLYVPSAMNMQHVRIVVLFGADHEKLWDITGDTLRAKIGDERYEATTKGKIALFKAAAGTILFFEDQTSVDALIKKFPSYSDTFPVWSLQSGGMHQFSAWVALEAEGLGASLQHYNPVIDAEVAAAWNLPKSWKLQAELVFGGRTNQVEAKAANPLEDRYKVFGADPSTVAST